MNSLEKTLLICDELNKYGFDNILVSDCRDNTELFDYVIFCCIETIEQNREISYIIDSLILQNELELLSKDGNNISNWVIMDFKDCILHIYLKEANSKYSIEKLYSNVKKFDKFVRKNINKDK